MKDLLKKRETIFLIFITALAAILRFFRLTRADMIGDPAHYSFRSIGYVDTVISQLQTTPLHWFGYFPWWSKLSFHDHPPLSFLIQHFFFKIFGISLSVARLPHALFGVFSVVALYFLVKRLYGKNCALLASFLLALSSYHVWISQSGFIEGILIFFIILTLIYWLKALEDEKYFIFWAIFFALCILTKYLALALIPVFFFWLVLDKNNWQILKNKKFYLSLLVFLVIISPLIIYNYMMYKTRGHFDMQFSFLFNQEHNDWAGITARKVGGNYLYNVKTIFDTLAGALPLPFYLLFLVGFLFILFEYLYKKVKRHQIIILVLLFYFYFFVVISGADRWLSILAPFIYITIAYFLYKLKEILKVNKYVYLPVLLILSGYLLFFTINTNHLYRPIGQDKILYSHIRIENLGYNQLGDWLEDSIRTENLDKPKEVKIIDDIFFLVNINDVSKSVGSRLYVYDENINWFAKMWYFKVKSVYFNIPIISSFDLVTLLGYENGEKVINALGPEGVYFFKVTDEVLEKSGEYISESADALERKLIESGMEPLDIIINPRGEEAFRIYYFPGITRI